MAYSLLAHTHFKGASNGGTTSAINTTGADLIVLGVVSNLSGITAPTDSKSNTWTGLTLKASSQEKAQIFYCQNPTTDASHTFSVGGTGQFQGVYVQAFSGSRSSPFDVENGSTATNATSLQPGSVTPSLNNELLIAFESDDYAGGSGGIQSIDSSFTITDQENQQSFTCLGASMAYLVQGSASAVNPTWTVTGGNRNFAGVIATFKPLGDVNVNLTAVSGTGSAASLTVTADKNTSLTSVTSSGAAASLAFHIDSNITLAIASGAGSAQALVSTPGAVLVSVSASGVASSFTQNKIFTLSGTSASGAALGLFSMVHIVSQSAVGAMSDKLAIDAIATDRPVASNGTMSNEPVAAIGSLLAA